LRLPTPLRTGLESFPSSGSSTPKSNPYWATRPLLSHADFTLLTSSLQPEGRGRPS